MHPTRNLITDWRPDDAAKVARLESEASVTWPGADDWQVSPEHSERWIRQSDLLGAFITEDGDRAVSLSTLEAKPGQ